MPKLKQLIKIDISLSISGSEEAPLNEDFDYWQQHKAAAIGHNQRLANSNADEMDNNFSSPVCANLLEECEDSKNLYF